MQPELINAVRWLVALAGIALLLKGIEKVYAYRFLIGMLLKFYLQRIPWVIIIASCIGVAYAIVIIYNWYYCMR